MDDYAAIAGLYDHVTLYRARPDVRFFVDAALEAGSPVLEVGSGTGRVLIPTAREGIAITGLDASAAMLAVCRQALNEEDDAVGARVTLVEGDMRGFDLGRRFRLVTLPFRPFQHLVSVEDQLACLASIRRHLEPDGRMVLDLFNPSLEALARPVGGEPAQDAEFSTPDGKRVVRSYRIVSRDLAEQVMRVEMFYDVAHPDGRAERLVHRFPMRWLFRFEVEHLLVRAGFRVTALYAGYDKAPFGSVYPGELLFVAAPAGPAS